MVTASRPVQMADEKPAARGMNVENTEYSPIPPLLFAPGELIMKPVQNVSTASFAASDAAPDDIDLAFAAADVQLFQRDIDGAFNRLIALVKKTAGDERTRVRTQLISLFDLFDPADPEVIAGRRNLANALY